MKCICNAFYKLAKQLYIKAPSIVRDFTVIKHIQHWKNEYVCISAQVNFQTGKTLYIIKGSFDNSGSNDFFFDIFDRFYMSVI